MYYNQIERRGFMDYDIEMLKLYFKEMNFNKQEIASLLDNNPFNEDYIIWEKQTKNDNKTLSNILKYNHMISKQTKIHEITNHENNRVSIYLQNESSYSICPVNGDLNNTIFNNNLILMKGYFPNQFKFIKKISNYNIPFIAGTCTRNYNYYSYMYKYYQVILKSINNLELIEDVNEKQKICILKTK
jgi:hypothetical protein